MELGLLRLLASLIAVSTLFLVALGGYVRATGAGLACPDWPLCFGRVVPPDFGGGVAQEVFHRYLATMVGIGCIAMVMVSYRLREQQRRCWRFCCAMFGLVIVQGVFGGLTVR